LQGGKMGWAHLVIVAGGGGGVKGWRGKDKRIKD
jgi:hypothetical protein